jgi:DNA gyrase subunit A
VLRSGDSTLLAVTENGFGKRSETADYRITGRGGKGIITIKATERNGSLVAIKEVGDEDELMITTKKGIVIRLPLRDVRSMGRNTAGVKLINLDDEDTVADVARLAQDDEDGAAGGEE